MESNFSDQTFVVTGATSGIGLAAAAQLAQQGGRVIGVGRSPQRCDQAQAQIEAQIPGVRLTYLVADLAEQTEVRRLGGEIRQILNQEERALDALINNAGLFQYWLTLTSEGFEMQWAVNHLAPFLLTHELLPHIKKAPAGRVVTVSSSSHYRTHLHWEDLQLRRRYIGLLAYQQTKLANVLFSSELNRRLDGVGRAFAADPGLVNTEIGAKSDSLVARWFWNLRKRGGITPEKSAQGLVYLATEPSIQTAPEIYWKHGKPKQPSRYALDAEAARLLWDISENMCGIAPGGYGL